MAPTLYIPDITEWMPSKRKWWPSGSEKSIYIKIFIFSRKNWRKYDRKSILFYFGRLSNREL